MIKDVCKSCHAAHNDEWKSADDTSWDNCCNVRCPYKLVNAYEESQYDKMPAALANMLRSVITVQNYFYFGKDRTDAKKYPDYCPYKMEHKILNETVK